MSDYYHASKIDDCPKCGSSNASNSKYKFRCSNCPFMFP